MIYRLLVGLAAASLLGLAPAFAAAPVQISAPLTAPQLFVAAADARAQGKLDDALTLYDALIADDPSPDVRAEARFRKGQALAAAGRYAEAAVVFRALLDDKPDALPVRLQLAQVLAQLGQDAAAQAQLRQARAGGLPPDVALAAERFDDMLQTSRRVSGSVRLALAPDSNINRATEARTIDTIIAPLTLSKDARATSGIGGEFGGSLVGQVPVATGLTLRSTASTDADVYPRHEFDDVSGALEVALDKRLRQGRISPAIAASWRWYGGQPYAETQGVSFGWTHAPPGPVVVGASAGATWINYDLNPLQSGELYQGGIQVQRALDVRTGIGLSLSASRQTARDPGYADWAGGASISAWREAARATWTLSAQVQRLVADKRIFFYPERRRDWLAQVSIGASLRRLTVGGFAPTVRLGYERNFSTVALYDYQRWTSNFGIQRAF